MQPRRPDTRSMEAGRRRGAMKRAMVCIGALAALATQAGAAPTARCCMTDEAGWYAEAPANTERRFALYKSLGVDMLRIEVEWRAIEPREGTWNTDYLTSYLALAKREGFRVKLIVAGMSAPPKWYLDAHPDARIVDENGQTSRNTLSYWYPGLRKLLEEKARRILAVIEHAGLMDQVDYVIPALGPANEPIYPVPWTLART